MRDRSGVPPWAAEDLPRTARAAGFDVLHTNGVFFVLEPQLGFEIYAAMVAALKERAIQTEVATAQAVEELVNTLRAATNGDYQWVASCGCLDLTLRLPMPA